MSTGHTVFYWQFTVDKWYRLFLDVSLEKQIHWFLWSKCIPQIVMCWKLTLQIPMVMIFWSVFRGHLGLNESVKGWSHGARTTEVWARGLLLPPSHFLCDVALCHETQQQGTHKMWSPNLELAPYCWYNKWTHCLNKLPFVVLYYSNIKHNKSMCYLRFP